jgi:hypothetical protein
MADVSAQDVLHFIKRDTDLSLRSLVCLTTVGTSTTKSTTTVDTRCGTKTATGNSDTTFTGTGTVDDDPDPTEVSYMEMREIAEADEEFLIVEKNTSGSIYIAGTGKITDISDTNDQGNLMTYSYSVKISGALDLNAAS